MKDIHAQFHASLANCTNAFVTLYTEPFASPCRTDESDALVAGWCKAFLKEANFLINPHEYILRKCQPGKRGFVTGDGTVSPSMAVDANGRPIVTMNTAIAADQSLRQKPVTFQIIWGAKHIPQEAAKDGEQKHYEQDALGLASFHEGAGQAESSNTTRKVFSISLESMSGTGLDAMGSSSRSGKGLTVSMPNCGTDTGSIKCSQIYLLLEYTQKIELRTGTVRSMD